jgi:DNA repair protein RadC
MGQAKAMQILALFELNKRHNMAKHPIKKISCAKDVFDLFYDRLKLEKQEHLIILMLNHMNNIVGEKWIAKGALDSATTNMRDIFNPAIKNFSSRIIIAHNHPSGNTQPSEEDILLTKKEIESGKLLNIDLIDHVIIGGEDYWSWRGN